MSELEDLMQRVIADRDAATAENAALREVAIETSIRAAFVAAGGGEEMPQELFDEIRGKVKFDPKRKLVAGPTGLSLQQLVFNAQKDQRFAAAFSMKNESAWQRLERMRAAATNKRP